VLERALQPAHLGWRVAQSLTDDLIVSVTALCAVAVVGMLPDTVSVRDLAQAYNQPVEFGRRLFRLVPTASLVYVVYWAAKLGYQTGFLTICHGQTLGCWLFGVQVVMKDGHPVTWRAAAGRTIAGGVMAQVPVIGQVLRFLDYLAALFNHRRQAVRDMAAGTMLVYACRFWLRREGSVRG
jgi:uncharacterized RDD family membrane protein YckC